MKPKFYFENFGIKNIKKKSKIYSKFFSRNVFSKTYSGKKFLNP